MFYSLIFTKSDLILIIANNKLIISICSPHLLSSTLNSVSMNMFSKITSVTSRKFYIFQEFFFSDDILIFFTFRLKIYFLLFSQHFALICFTKKNCRKKNENSAKKCEFAKLIFAGSPTCSVS